MRSGQVDVSGLLPFPPWKSFSNYPFFIPSPIQPTRIKEQMMTVAATIKIDLDADDDDAPKKEEVPKEEPKKEGGEASTEERGEDA
jgi:hypothetical protein